MKPNSRRGIVVLAGIEAISVLLIGVGVGLHDLGAGLAIAGALIWINLTIGGLRKR